MDRAALVGVLRHPREALQPGDAERQIYPEDDRARQSLALVANLRAAYGPLGPRLRPEVRPAS